MAGNEETGIKPLAQQPSLGVAGVPIKKRRFIWPPSPTPEEQSLQPPVANDSIQKEHENKKGPDDIVQTERNNHASVKIEEPSFKIQSDPLAKVEDKEKIVEAEKSANMLASSAVKSTSILASSAKTELGIASGEASEFNARKETQSQQIVEGNCTPEISLVVGNSEMSLGQKEHLVSASVDHKNVGTGQSQQNGLPISLNLSLSQGECSVEGKGDDDASANVRASRSNWDLNTTMDTWESFSTDKAADRVTANASNTTGVTHDIKPLICSTAMDGTGIISEKKFLEEGERRSSFTGTFTKPTQQYTAEDSLNLRLSPSFLSLNSDQEPSSSSANKNSGRVISKISLPIELAGSAKIVNSRTIKSEPFDGSLKLDGKVPEGNPMPLLDIRAIKHELVDRYAQELLKTSNFSPLKLVDPRSIKAEPQHEGNLETLKTVDGTSHQSHQQVLQGQNSGEQSSCSTEKQVSQNQYSSQELMTCSTGKNVLQVKDTPSKLNCLSVKLAINDNASGQVENAKCAEGVHLSKGVTKDASKSAGLVTSTTVSSIPMDQSGNELNVSGVEDNSIAEDRNVDNSEECKLKLAEDRVHASRGSGEGPMSDEEKINLSGDMLEEDCYGSDFESDGNSVPMDIEEDGGHKVDNEDGEVEESQLHNAAEGPMSGKREDVSHVEFADEKGNLAELPDDHYPTSSNVETGKYPIKGSNSTHVDGETIENVDKYASAEEPSAVEMLMGVAEKNEATEIVPGQPLDILVKIDATKGQGREQSFDQASSGGQGTLVNDAQGSNETSIRNDMVKNDSELPKGESSFNGYDASKDLNTGVNRSRIINLSRASNMSSPGGARSMPGKPLPSRPGRERLPDVPLEGDKLHPRGRDEIYNNGVPKFSRERHQDHLYRNPRFGRGRGRVSSRIDTIRGDDSERDFAPEFYNGPPNYGIPRNKYVAEAEAGFINYSIEPDGAFIGGDRGGRKLMDDETPIFRRQPSRRRSPGGRDGPPARNIHMVRRVPRSIGEEGSEGVGLRHADKFIRFPDDGTEHAFTRPQPPYEGLDGQFVQGTRNFSPAQRRGLPQIHSKSPTRSRSPGLWSSLRRRSPDGFGGPPELPRRRSPPIYRMERITDHPVFPGEMVVRRHGSPSYLARASDLRDMDPGQDHGQPRSIISNRSQTGRVILRNNRRYGVVDPRERTDGDGFLGGPMHSGRFHELGGDGNGEERRRFGERRGPIRSFRPPFTGVDGEDFHLNTEDGPRPFRFFQEDDPQFHERANLREREFDRRVKNRPGNAPRRPRSIEEQDGNYRHGGQVLYGDEFDDASQAKRKRF